MQMQAFNSEDVNMVKSSVIHTYTRAYVYTTSETQVRILSQFSWSPTTYHSHIILSVKTDFAKTTHTFPHKDFPQAGSDNQQLCSKYTLFQIVKYLQHAYQWNPGCVRIQCFV